MGGRAGKAGGFELALGKQSDESSSRVGLPFPWLLGRAPRTPGLAARLKEKEELEAPIHPYVLAVSVPLTTPARSLDLTGPLLLGGVPDLPESFPVRTRHFVGCMRDLQVDSRHVDMADFIANNGTMPGMGAGVRLNAERRDVPGVGAPGSGGLRAPSSHCHRFSVGSLCPSTHLSILGCPAKKNVCDSNTCHNGGTCVNQWDAFSCECPLGFGGKSCAQGRYGGSCQRLGPGSCQQGWEPQQGRARPWAGPS